MISPAELVNRAANRAMTPPPLLSVADWSDENRFLGGDSSEAGRYRTNRTPYARQIMECLSPFHPARHVVWEKAVQLGATTVGLNWIGYIIDQCPAPMIITLPSEGVAKEWSNQRLTQLVDETPCLQGKILEAAKKGSGNTIYLKRIAGTSVTVKIAWSSSAKKLRSTPAAYLLSDEVDGFEGDTDGEGNPLVLLDGRFVTFPRGKHFKISTPTHPPSRINAEFLKGDQRYYFVPCPYCGHFQALVFSRVRYSDGPLGYQCQACEQKFQERFKTQFLARGIWAATAGREELLKQGFDDPKVLAPVFAAMDQARFASFHLPATYSPIGWYSWGEMVEDWKKAQGIPTDLKAFVNTKLAEVWRDRGEAPAAEVVFGKREAYNIGTVPQGGLFLTMFVDVQVDRLEWEVKAWGRNRQSWSVEADVIGGDTNMQPCWDCLAELISRDWRHVSDATMPLWAVGIDSGYRPQKVYEFCSRYAQPAYGPAGAKVAAVRTVVPTKGGHAWDRAIEGFSSIEGARKRDGLRIITLGASYLKQAVYDALRIPMPTAGEYPAGYWHYPGYEFFWFQGLTSESRVVRNNGHVEWVKDSSVRNEPLDLAVGNLAMAALCGIDRMRDEGWARLEFQVSGDSVPRPPAPRQPTAQSTDRPNVALRMPPHPGRRPRFRLGV